jgi:hypothetical protein
MSNWTSRVQEVREFVKLWMVRKETEERARDSGRPRYRERDYGRAVLESQDKIPRIAMAGRHEMV